MQIRKHWEVKEEKITEEILQACGNNKILATLLANRGINTSQKIQEFLNPLKMKLSSPYVFVDMQKAVQRIKNAIETNQHITVFGDFDADGITSCSLLYLTLKEIGADVDYYLPDRATEGHGLNTKALVNLISKKKTKLIITVDCGISDVREVKFAKGFKTDVIITDHHESPEIMPSAFAIINPKAPNALQADLQMETIENLNYLAGVGVAFKVACALLEEFRKQDFVNRILPLVAIGTIGDLVELIGENRSLVEMGLELIRAGKHTGIQELLVQSGMQNIPSLTSENVAFTIVPRLNAAGRLETPYTAISLLVSEDKETINAAVKTLNDLNTLRQTLCDEVFNKVKAVYLAEKFSNKKSIIILEEDRHVGIIGIVASKLVEQYNKPTFLMTRDVNNPNIIRCSCRSIDGINIHSVLCEHKEKFEGFGGHKMAAGFSFDETKIKFNDFKIALNKTIDEFSRNIDFNTVKVSADMILEPEEINSDTVKIIDKLQPFGAANPAPLFIMKDLILKSYKMMGQNNNHLKLFVNKDNSNLLQCVKWNYPDFNVSENSLIDILFSPQINTFNGEVNIQLMLSDIHSDQITYQTEKQIKILDHRNKKDILSQVLEYVAITKKTTAIYVNNMQTVKLLNIPENISDKLFTFDKIPNEAEQLMFFDCPLSDENFSKIVKEINPQIVHLMNFNSAEITIEMFVSKLSGMLRYCISSLGGIVNIKRLSDALVVTCEIVENALILFAEVGMISLIKIDEQNYKISDMCSVELSKIKQADTFKELDYQLSEINEFKRFYINSSIDDIRGLIEC